VVVEVDEDVDVDVDADADVGVGVPDVGDDVGALLPDKVVIASPVEVAVASLSELVKLIEIELPSC
jgi:hypothetical protein